MSARQRPSYGPTFDAWRRQVEKQEAAKAGRTRTEAERIARREADARLEMGARGNLVLVSRNTASTDEVDLLRELAGLPTARIQVVPRSERWAS